MPILPSTASMVAETIVPVHGGPVVSMYLKQPREFLNG